MTKPRSSKCILSIVLMSVASVSLAFQAGNENEYGLIRDTVDSGAWRSSGEGFELSGTIGQTDAGQMTDGDFVLTGGFWFEIVTGDVNSDGVADILDYGGFSGCVSGPESQPQPGCAQFDFNTDGSVDLIDFALFQGSVNGS